MPDRPTITATRTRKILLIILGVALAIHLLSDIAVYTLRPQSISTTPDPLDYRLAALNLLHYNVFTLAPVALDLPEVLRTPVYPFLLAHSYRLDGETGLAMIIFQSFMLIIMGGLLFGVLKAFLIPDNLALALTSLYLFEPFQWLYTLQTMTETLASFLMLILFTGALVGKGITDWSRAALYGFGLGILVLEKPSSMMWLPFFIGLILVAQGNWQQRFLRVAVVVLMFGATLSPWLIRNYMLTRHIVVSSSGVYSMIMFNTTPATAPPWFYQVVTTVSYNGHSNEVWYAYTANAYPKLIAEEHLLLGRTDYRSLITSQVMCVPSVWFGFIVLKDQESYGHEYSLIADFAAGVNQTRDMILNVIDTVVWSVILVLGVFGSVFLILDSSLRWRFAPLLCMLFSALFINLCFAWTRVLLPLYPVIFIATGVGLVHIRAIIAGNAWHVMQ